MNVTAGDRIGSNSQSLRPRRLPAWEVTYLLYAYNHRECSTLALLTIIIPRTALDHLGAITHPAKMIQQHVSCPLNHARVNPIEMQCAGAT